MIVVPRRAASLGSPSLVRSLARNVYRLVVKILHVGQFYESRNVRYAAAVRVLLGPRLDGGGVLLDLGCGPGGVTSKLLGPYAVIGVDRDRYLLDRFVDPSVPRVLALAERLPFRPGSVDVAVALSLIEHLSNQGHFLRELSRILKSDGHVVLQLPELRYPIEPHTKWPLLYWMKPSVQSAVLSASGYGDVDLSTTLNRVQGLAIAHGLDVERTLPVSHFAVAKLLRRPMGYFLLLRKPPGRTSREGVP